MGDVIGEPGAVDAAIARGPIDASPHASGADGALLGEPADAASAGAPRLELYSGNAQMVLEWFPSAEPLVVRAVGADGAPLAGVAVTFALTQGDGGLTLPNATTDADGRAQTGFTGTLVPGGWSAAKQRVTASSAIGSVEFMVTTTEGGMGIPIMPLVQLQAPDPAARDLGRGRVGDVLYGAVRVVVVNQVGPQAGQPLDEIGLRVERDADDGLEPDARCVGGLVLTGADGVATCDVELLGPPGTGRLRAVIGGALYFGHLAVEIDP